MPPVLFGRANLKHRSHRGMKRCSTSRSHDMALLLDPKADHDDKMAVPQHNSKREIKNGQTLHYTLFYSPSNQNLDTLRIQPRMRNLIIVQESNISIIRPIQLTLKLSKARQHQTHCRIRHIHPQALTSYVPSPSPSCSASAASHLHHLQSIAPGRMWWVGEELFVHVGAVCYA